MLVVSLDTQGIEGLVESVGIWDIVARWAAAVMAGRMEAEDRWGSAPPKTLLCSADHRAPAV